MFLKGSTEVETTREQDERRGPTLDEGSLRCDFSIHGVSSLGTKGALRIPDVRLDEEAAQRIAP